MNLNPDIPVPRFKITGSLLFLIIGFAPIFSILISGLISLLLGCTLYQGFPDTCAVFGDNIGELLSMGAFIGWFGIFTMPIGIIGSVVFLITESNSHKKKSIPAPMSHKIAKWMLISMALFYIVSALIDYIDSCFSYSGFNI